MQAERDDDLYQSKVERPQVRVMNNNTRKTVDNAKKTFQDAQSAVHGAREREESTKKRAEADVHAAHVRELQTDISFQDNIDEVKVKYQHNMKYQAKRATTVLANEKFTAQKNLKKHSAASEAIVGDASQNISQLKHEVSFQKEDIDHERLSGDKDVSQERAMGKETLLLDQKFQSNQLTEIKQRQYSAQSTDSRISSELLEQVEKLKIDPK